MFQIKNLKENDKAGWVFLHRSQNNYYPVLEHEKFIQKEKLFPSDIKKILYKTKLKVYSFLYTSLTENPGIFSQTGVNLKERSNPLLLCGCNDLFQTNKSCDSSFA